MPYKIQKVDLIRKIEGKELKEWDFLVDTVVDDLESYRTKLKEKYRATKVDLTYSEIPKEEITNTKLLP